MSRNNVMAVGVTRIPLPQREVLLPLLRSTMEHMEPTSIITDYAPGWGEMAIQSALDLGVPIIGAAPFPTPLVERYRRKVRTSSVFAKSPSDFSDHEEAYLGWIERFADRALVYFPPGSSSFSHEAILGLGLEVRNLHHKGA